MHPSVCHQNLQTLTHQVFPYRSGYIQRSSKHQHACGLLYLKLTKLQKTMRTVVFVCVFIHRYAILCQNAVACMDLQTNRNRMPVTHTYPHSDIWIPSLPHRGTEIKCFCNPSLFLHSDIVCLRGLFFYY